MSTNSAELVGRASVCGPKVVPQRIGRHRSKDGRKIFVVRSGAVCGFCRDQTQRLDFAMCRVEGDEAKQCRVDEVIIVMAGREGPLHQQRAIHTRVGDAVFN